MPVGEEALAAACLDVTSADARGTIGFTCTFPEGMTLEGLTQKSSKLGDGKAWTPNVTGKGGASGFYSIGVKK